MGALGWTSGRPIEASIVDAKGDLITATAPDTPVRLPVGGDGQSLRANTLTPSGLEWSALTALDVGAIPVGLLLNTINGLQGGGTLGSGLTVQPTYGNVANTVAQGNDPRIVNAVQSTLFDAKGDLISASAPDTPVRVPVGPDGYVLVANSAAPSGLEWVEVSALTVSASAIVRRTSNGVITAVDAYLRGVVLNSGINAATVTVRAGGAGGTIILELGAKTEPTTVCPIDNALCVGGIHVALTGGGTPNVTVVYAEV
jgi:hypothetical protein